MPNPVTVTIEGMEFCSLTDAAKAALAMGAQASLGAIINRLFAGKRTWEALTKASDIRKPRSEVVERKSPGLKSNRVNNRMLWAIAYIEDGSVHTQCWRCKEFKKPSQFTKKRRRGLIRHTNECKKCKNARIRKTDGHIKRRQERRARITRELSDPYIVQLIGVANAEIPKQLIELKRAHVQLTRQLKEMKKCQA